MGRWNPWFSYVGSTICFAQVGGGATPCQKLEVCQDTLDRSETKTSKLQSDFRNVNTLCFRPQILILLKLNDQLEPKYRKMLTFSSQLKAGECIRLCVQLR